jgi:hypothetical protein
MRAPRSNLALKRFCEEPATTEAVAVEAVTAPGDPYGEPVRVRPESGLLVVFPSWLYHWVHPYAGQPPRIAVSFNATVGAVGAATTSTSADASDEIQTSPASMST